MTSKTPALFLVVGSFVLFLHSPAVCLAQTQDIGGGIQHQPWIPTGQIRKLFDELIELKDLQGNKSLKEVLQILETRFAKKGKKVQFVINQEAFKKEDPDAPDIERELVRMPLYPKRLTIGTALRLALSRIGSGNATYWLRAGQVLVTTHDKASSSFFLQTQIDAVNINQRPLTQALDELAEWSGTTILVDRRVWQKAQVRVTAKLSFFQLETAVRLLTDMAGLKPVVVDNVIYVTSPENAEHFKEKTTIKLSSTISGMAFKDRPLSSILDDKFTWSNLIVDARVKDKTKVRVTAKFINAVEQETALRLLTDMAGLKYVVVDNILYITSPANARRLEEEQARGKPDKR